MEIYEEHNFNSSSDASLRCVTEPMTICKCLPYAVQDDPGTTLRSCGPGTYESCSTVWVSVNCGNSGNDSSWPPSSGSSNPPPAGTYGSNSVSGTSPAQYLQNLESLCLAAANQTGDEGPGEAILLTQPLAADQCAVQFAASGNLSTNNLYQMLKNGQNPDVFNYIVRNGVNSNWEMLNAYLTLNHSLTLRKFDMNFDFLQSFLNENPYKSIDDFTVINNVAFILDDDGILHVNLDPLDMENSTNEEKLDHALTLIRLVKLYHCDNDFEAIDWRDYIFPVDAPTSDFIANWNSPLGNTISLSMVLDFTTATLPQHYLMSPSVTDDPLGSNSWKYRWDRYVPNATFPIPMLSITTQNSGIADVDSAVHPDCN